MQQCTGIFRAGLTLLCWYQYTRFLNQVRHHICVQLPTRVLSETLESAPADFKAKLQEYARSPACPSNQRGPISRLLEGVGGPASAAAP